MGTISYPRTDGTNKGKVFVDQDGYVYLNRPRSNKKELLRYDGFKVYNYDYVKRSAEERTGLREEFDKTVKKDFLINLASTKQDEMLIAGFTQGQIDKMAKGEGIGRDWQVHHHLPLDNNGDNRFENLILIRDAQDHQGITALQNGFSRSMQAGESRNVDFIIPEDASIGFYPLKVNQEPIVISKFNPKD